MTIPTKRECLEILEEAGVPEEVIEHAQLVEALAIAIAEAINERHPEKVNMRLVTAGALLHDLGRAKTHGIEHVRHGVQRAEAMGLDPQVVEIIRRHVGGGLRPEEAKGLGLPEWDCMPGTLEEMVVNHADTLVGSKGRRTLLQTLKRIRQKKAPTYEARVRDLHAHLSGLAERDLDSFGPWMLPFSREESRTRRRRRRREVMGMHDIPKPPHLEDLTED